MGRPGWTENALKGLADAEVDTEAGFYIVGPELPDISSTAVQDVLATRRDPKMLTSLLHPKVLEVCETKWSNKTPELARPQSSAPSPINLPPTEYQTR